MNDESLPIKDTPYEMKPASKTRLIGIIGAVVILLCSVVFVIDRLFTDFEPSSPVNIGDPITSEDTKNSLKGRIKYTNPANYPEEDISYKLVDKDGKDLILLKCEDEKLKVAENLSVEVRGLQTKTKAGEDVLIVEEIIISN